jgi:hypothetical protein
MSDVSCVIFYAGKMLQTIEFPQVALNINLFEGPLAYSETTDLNKRHEADKVLIEKARERLKAKDCSFGEKAAAYRKIIIYHYYPIRSANIYTYFQG